MNEYLSELRDFHRQKIKSTGSIEINEGDVVLFVDRDIPRQRWNLGIIVEISTGKDGLIRSAAVRLGSTRNIITRPVNRLIPIEVCMDKTVPKKLSDTSCDILNDTDNSTRNSRPRREAAVLGELKRIYGSPDVDVVSVDGGSVE